MTLIERLLSTNENLLWKDKPNINKDNLIVNDKKFLTFSVFTSTIISLIIAILLYIYYMDAIAWVLFIVIGFTIWSLQLMYRGSNKNVYLKGVSYFISNQKLYIIYNIRVFGLEFFSTKYIRILNLSDIDFYFITHEKNNNSNLNLRITFNNSQQIRDSFFKTSFNNDENKFFDEKSVHLIQMLNQRRKITLVFCMQRIREIEEVSKILNKILPDKLKVPPSNWEIETDFIFRR